MIEFQFYPQMTTSVFVSLNKIQLLYCFFNKQNEKKITNIISHGPVVLFVALEITVLSLSLHAPLFQGLNWLTISHEVWYES